MKGASIFENKSPFTCWMKSVANVATAVLFYSTVGAATSQWYGYGSAKLGR